MVQPVRLFLLILIFLAGVASLLATSPLPPPALYAITLNNFEDDEYGYAQAFACPDEKATLKWNAFEGGTPRLSAAPLENVVPELKNKSVTREGSLEMSILGDAELTLEVGRDLPDGYLQVGLVPTELCTGYGFPLVGWYEGQLEQTLPVPSTFERQLRLVWTREGEDRFLRAELTDKLSSPQFLDVMRCDYASTTSDLICTSEGDKTLRFELTVTADGLAGTYSGKTASGLDFEGSLMVQKQSGAPPQETP